MALDIALLRKAESPSISACKPCRTSAAAFSGGWSAPAAGGITPARIKPARTVLARIVPADAPRIGAGQVWAGHAFDAGGPMRAETLEVDMRVPRARQKNWRPLWFQHAQNSLLFSLERKLDISAEQAHAGRLRTHLHRVARDACVQVLAGVFEPGLASIQISFFSGDLCGVLLPSAGDRVSFRLQFHDAVLHLGRLAHQQSQLTDDRRQHPPEAVVVRNIGPAHDIGSCKGLPLSGAASLEALEQPVSRRRLRQE